MNRNVRIAKELVRIAKELTALSDHQITKSFAKAVNDPNNAPSLFKKIMPTVPKTGADGLDPELEDDPDSVEI